MRRYRFLPNAGRAKVAVAALLCAIASRVAFAGLYAWFLPQIGELEDATSAEQLEAALGIAMLAALVFSAIAFLFWFRRAYENAFATGLRSVHGPGWAIGGWFVPFLNLVRPYQIARSMWQHVDRQRVGGAPIVGVWWTLFLGAGLLDNLSSRLLESAVTIDQVSTALVVSIAGDACAIVGALFAVTMIRRLTRALDDLHLTAQAEVFE